MDESKCLDASLVTHDYERDFNDPLLATPSKSPPGKKKKDCNDVSLAEIFNAIQSMNAKQDSVIQKITRIESSIEVTTAEVSDQNDSCQMLPLTGKRSVRPESSIQHIQQENASLKLRVEEQEMYSSRWCLKLIGVK